MPLYGGRSTFQPYLGSGGAVPTDAAGNVPSQVDDFDGDGIPDGIEDWNADGLVGADESSPYLADQDNDGLHDGIELRIWGPMTFQSYISNFGGDVGRAGAARAYDPTAPLETNPKAKDSDGDGIEDSFDLNPKGLTKPVFGLVFRSFQMLDRIDEGWNGRYTIDPYVLVTVETAWGTASLDSGDLPAFPLGGPEDVFDLGGTTFFWRALTDPIGLIPSPEVGALSVRLPEDLSKVDLGSGSTSGDALRSMRFTVSMGDVDCAALIGKCRRDPSDIVDIGPSVDSTSHVWTTRVGSWLMDGCAAKQDETMPRPADGGADGKDTWTGAEDDGILRLAAVDYIRAEFMERAVARRLGAPIDPPANPAQSFGGCS